MVLSCGDEVLYLPEDGYLDCGTGGDCSWDSFEVKDFCPETPEGKTDKLAAYAWCDPSAAQPGMPCGTGAYEIGSAAFASRC
jgi:hypothetical protein